MSNDYTLPIAPDLRAVPHGQLAACVVNYGHACAEHARAQLAEENARLKDRLRSVCQALVTAVGADGPCDAEDAAARAVARIAELEVLLSEVVSDTAEELGCAADNESILLAAGNLRAEVEKYRADAERLSDFVLSNHTYESNSYATRCLDCDADVRNEPHKKNCVVLIAARKGEGSEG